MGAARARERRTNDGKKERRVEVLDAARELFFDKGYRGTTIQQIAQRAGYSKRTVYLDYLNKDELFITLCAEGGAVLLGMLRDIHSDELPVETLVDRFLDVYITFSRANHEYFRMIFSEATPEIITNCSPALRDRVADLERACLRVVVSWIERAVREGQIAPVDPWETAGICVGSATGIILLSMGGSQTVYAPATLERLAKRSIRTYWRGLRADAPATTVEA